MDISIIYCSKCNFDPRVNHIVNAIKEHFSVEPTLVPVDRRGTFDVAVDGKVILSKDELGHLPRDKEVISCLKLMQ